MTRSEHVRCENCCYWGREDKRRSAGLCRRGNASTIYTWHPPGKGEYGGLGTAPQEWPYSHRSDWCGEFRETWPEVHPSAIHLNWDNDAKCWRWHEVRPEQETTE